MERRSFAALPLVLGGCFAAGVMAGGLAIATASASEFERVAPVKEPLTAKECSACHMLYPPGLLTVRSWRELMAGLKDHFGENAELDKEATDKITAYLVANAARDRRDPTDKASMRITEQPWFRRKHEKKGRISPETLNRRGAKSASDCRACHKQAEQGYFEDD